jgi:pre-mRNA-processing factor 8
VKATDDSEDDFSVMGLEPLLTERPLYTDATAGGIALYFAPRPVNLRRGRTRRAFDVPLVNAWFKERCPADHPVKVHASVSIRRGRGSFLFRFRVHSDPRPPTAC